MGWSIGCIVILFCIGQTATTALFDFDLSSLRSDELFQPSCILQQPSPFSRGPTVKSCPVENHIKLSGSDKTIFMQRIEGIRNASANRAVAAVVQNDASLVDASLLAPIGRQIVQFTLIDISQSDLTSRLPAIGLSNLLDLRFWQCDGLRIHKTDFSGLQNIRAIEFQGSSPAFVEHGTFMSLPTLQTLALGNDIGNWNMERFAVYQQLKCDAKNAWLWKFLKQKPGLLKNRRTGDIFKLGNFTSSLLDVDQPEVKCK